MATNKKKIFVTESMSQPGRALLHARDDIELVEFPNMISQKDFEAKLKEHAPVHGVALGGTRFRPYPSEEAALLDVLRLGDDLARTLAGTGVQELVRLQRKAFEA